MGYVEHLSWWFVDRKNTKRYVHSSNLMVRAQEL